MDTSTIKNIANLARIELTQEEEELYSKQIEDILGYFEVLKEADTDNVDLDEISRGANLIQVRPDDSAYIEEKFSRDILISDIPEKEGEFVKVPSVVESRKSTKS